MARGYVIDFVDWHVALFGRVRHWPTFNIADAAITVGVLLIAVEILPRRVAAQGKVARPEGPAPPS
jgi:lipoprotein signal peptidase